MKKICFYISTKICLLPALMSEVWRGSVWSCLCNFRLSVNGTLNVCWNCCTPRSFCACWLVTKWPNVCVHWTNLLFFPHQSSSSKKGWVFGVGDGVGGGIYDTWNSSISMGPQINTNQWLLYTPNIFIQNLIFYNMKW